MNNNLDDMAYQFDFTRLTPDDLLAFGLSGFLGLSSNPEQTKMAQLITTLILGKTFVGDLTEISEDNAAIVIQDFANALKKWNDAGCPGMQRGYPSSFNFPFFGMGSW